MNVKKTREFRALLRELVRRLGHEETEGGYSCGLTFSQCHSLLGIGEMGPTTLVELAGSLRLDKSTVSRTVEDLVSLGLIQRREHPDDRRFKVLRLTAKGEAVRREIDARADDRFGRALKAIPNKSREPVLESLEILVRSLGDKNKSGATVSGRTARRRA
jgi:DNA-binding MarR family transcriptional regulator